MTTTTIVIKTETKEQLIKQLEYTRRVLRSRLKDITAPFEHEDVDHEGSYTINVEPEESKSSR